MYFHLCPWGHWWIILFDFIYSMLQGHRFGVNFSGDRIRPLPSLFFNFIYLVVFTLLSLKSVFSAHKFSKQNLFVCFFYKQSTQVNASLDPEKVSTGALLGSGRILLQRKEDILIGLPIMVSLHLHGLHEESAAWILSSVKKLSDEDKNYFGLYFSKTVDLMKQWTPCICTERVNVPHNYVH